MPGLPASAARLVAELKPLTRGGTDRPAQVIHSDLAGNILYADGTAPAIIDFSPQYRPDSYAEAVLIADAVAWHDAPLELAVDFLSDRPRAPDLARAVIFRIAASALQPDMPPAVVERESNAYRRLLPALTL